MSDMRDDDRPVEPGDPVTADGFDEDADTDDGNGLAATAQEIFGTGGDEEAESGESVERRPDGSMGME